MSANTIDQAAGRAGSGLMKLLMALILMALFGIAGFVGFTRYARPYLATLTTAPGSAPAQRPALPASVERRGYPQITQQEQQYVQSSAVEDKQVQQAQPAPAAQPAQAQDAAPDTAPARTLDHYQAPVPVPTSSLTQEQKDASAASEEQMMLNRECQGLTQTQCDVLGAQAQNAINITLMATPEPQP